MTSWIPAGLSMVVDQEEFEQNGDIPEWGRQWWIAIVVDV